jgi:TRAP-type C4-dicarboxylate transport system permease small subunit
MIISNMLKKYEGFINNLIVVLMSILIIDVFIQVLGRYVPFIPNFLWTMELANFLLIWIVFFGSIIGVARGKHFFIDLFSSRTSLLLNTFLKTVYYTVMLVVSFVFIFYGYKFVLMGWKQSSMVLDINLGIIHIVVPITGISWLMFLLNDLYSACFKTTKGDNLYEY